MPGWLRIPGVRLEMIRACSFRPPQGEGEVTRSSRRAEAGLGRDWWRAEGRRLLES